jgi:hypothetical protein
MPTTLESPVREENVDGADDDAEDDEATEWSLLSSIDEIVEYSFLFGSLELIC